MRMCNVQKEQNDQSIAFYINYDVIKITIRKALGQITHLLRSYTGHQTIYTREI